MIVGICGSTGCVLVLGPVSQWHGESPGGWRLYLEMPRVGPEARRTYVLRAEGKRTLLKNRLTLIPERGFMKWITGVTLQES